MPQTDSTGRSSEPQRILTTLLLSALVATSPVVAGIEDDLQAAWRGAFVVVLAETGSSCDDSYTNNPVTNGRVTPAGPHRLPAGEFARVANVDVKRSRIDLLLDMEEPLRISWTEGPFELFRQARCKVELEIAVSSARKMSVAESGEVFAAVVERHPDRGAAMGSRSWNRRQVQPMPRGYEDTLAQYRIWREEQLQVELAESLAEALEKADRVIERAPDSAAYGAGFAAGMEKQSSRYRSWDDCDELADESFYAAGRDAPGDYSGSEKREWERGYRQGQEVAFWVEWARELGKCMARG